MAMTSVLAFAACGDDDTSGTCGAGTVLQDGQCVPVMSTATTTSNPTDTVGGDTATTTTQDSSSTNTNPTVATDTSQPDVTNECTAEEAGKGFVGSPCTRDCQCSQNAGGKPLTCYNGPYMSGFSFCTRVIDNTLSENDGVESILWPSGCLTATNGTLTAGTPKIYVKGCTSLDQCKAISAAYTDCGTGDLDYKVSNNATECPCWNTSSGGYMSGCAMILKKSCLIRTTPPFNGDYVDDLDDPND